MSQDMDSFGISDEEPFPAPAPKKFPIIEKKKTELSETSKGYVVVAGRASKSGKNSIKKHALQKSFFAVPSDANEEEKNAVLKKVKDMVADYEANKYEAKMYELELPFSVEVIGGFTTGYCTATPKPVKADKKALDDIPEGSVHGKGKKRVCDDDSKPAKKAKAQ